MTLLNQDPAVVARTNEAIEAVGNANASWREQCIEHVLCSGIMGDEPFTADQITNAAMLVLDEPTDWRVMGSVIRTAVKRGIIEPTGDYRLPTYNFPRGHTQTEKKPVYKFTVSNA